MENMKKQEIDWQKVTTGLKLKFPILTDDDLMRDDSLIIMGGMHEAMLLKVQTKLYKTRAEVDIIISEL